jgi:hypothetical protein
MTPAQLHSISRNSRDYAHALLVAVIFGCRRDAKGSLGGGID